MPKDLERDVSKFVILSLYAAIIANVFTHGAIAVQLGRLVLDVFRTGLNAAGGRKV